MQGGISLGGAQQVAAVPQDPRASFRVAGERGVKAMEDLRNARSRLADAVDKIVGPDDKVGDQLVGQPGNEPKVDSVVRALHCDIDSISREASKLHSLAARLERAL
jgi:hypothetical protein